MDTPNSTPYTDVTTAAATTTTKEKLSSLAVAAAAAVASAAAARSDEADRELKELRLVVQEQAETIKRLQDTAAQHWSILNECVQQIAVITNYADDSKRTDDSREAEEDEYEEDALLTSCDYAVKREPPVAAAAAAYDSPAFFDDLKSYSDVTSECGSLYSTCTNEGGGGGGSGGPRVEVVKFFVGGLTRKICSMDLRSFFKGHGHVIDCEVVRNRRTLQSRGFGFVVMERTRGLAARLSAPGALVLDGKPLNVQEAVAKQDYRLKGKRKVESQPRASR